MPPIILASSSRYRAQLLENIGLSFNSSNPDIDESPTDNETPQALVERLSLAKARALSKTYNNHLIIGSDQVASLNNSIITKPGSHERAKGQLTACQGHTVCFYTGLCLLNSHTGNHQISTVTTEVTFRSLTDQQIENYLNREQPYDCAGSFKCEGLGITLFERINSSDPNALIGLPIIALTSMLTKEGVNPLD
jgi:7-methyl-GTP pyrophosphatase